MEQKNYNMKNCIYMGESQQFWSTTPKIIFCDVSGNPKRYPNYRITGITNYRTVPKYQNADVGRLITENSKFVKIDPKKFFSSYFGSKNCLRVILECVLYTAKYGNNPK